MEAAVQSAFEEQLRIGEEKEKENSEEPELTVTHDNQEFCNPESYMTKSVVETRLLNVADSFQRQYTVLFPDRKPLLLCPLNECGVKKFVSTTLQPSASSHCELQTWQGCAYFVANFLSLELLEPPVDLPKHLFSPTSVLRTRRATCFEFATLLCSLLLGINYDAYCVSGYAAKEMCLLDQSQFPCPLLDSDVKEEDSQQQPEDLLRGLRVHCWVLVLAGSGSIRENFFIDPLTGSSYPTDSSSFLGIESVWNDLNYHVNMQDCRNGCVGLKFDLDDTNLWEPVLHGATSRKQLILDVLNKKENRMISTEKEQEQPRVFEMPRSWVTFISIHEKDLETLWPDGKKVTFYKKAKLEKFAPYLNPDGVITRLTTYKDQDCAEVAMVKEWYKHRNDSLEEREVNKLKDSTSERFKYGRRFQLLFHRITSLSTGFEQQMEFSSYARPDYLARRVWSTNEMEEFYEGRRDFLCYRQVIFQPPDQFDDSVCWKSPLRRMRVLTVVERFHRNAAKPANEDVAERVFLVSEEQFELTYHLMDHRFIPSRRILTKPLFRKFSNDCVSTFQVDLCAKPLSTQALFKILGALQDDEAKLTAEIKDSLKEIEDIVACREQEQNQVKLRKRIKEAVPTCEDEEQRVEDENSLESWKVLISKNLDAEEANRLYHSLLEEFKDKMVAQANLLQERYEKDTRELHAKQNQYRRNHLTMTEKQLEEYQCFCSEKTTQIKATQIRLNRHKELAHERYKALEQKLQQNPVLRPHLKK
ncbi:dynein regulatory complex subunit 7 isoform X1 [Oryzias latipes]|uniref:dynein regulatory complex subunit 7 isoform X1 n=1 Tax=Oryzias latipes TaxID=8090 RepID=UPI000CE1F979|nr:dynein regulatory complex subunit 7 isoform X1 [Oryzias latipes]XP_023812758.1 dynein regulatory complex subunit 7 isoform X1 [Oryzias latipes]XP_023812759.1 dynein regulatory complex subunit 7 isoform X1 [Oryzias latipes]XP_023812760.1 dynein regulatory complex subunit 7 isoform X1 [Oryzias latipes]